MGLSDWKDKSESIEKGREGGRRMMDIHEVTQAQHSSHRLVSFCGRLQLTESKCLRGLT